MRQSFFTGKANISNPVRVLEELARHTWSRIADGHQLGVRQGEVAITDYLLLEIARQRLRNIIIAKTPHNLERFKGTDWEWWIGSRRAGWIRYAVQAKRILFPTDYYVNLGHRVNGQPQVDLLTRYARANGAVAVYCFYNCTRISKIGPFWHCNFSPEQEQLGCTIAPASVVRAALRGRGTKTFQHIHTHKSVRPWRCLLCCPKILALYNKTGKRTPTSESLFDEPEITIHPNLPPGLENVSEGGEIEAMDRRYFNREVECYPRYLLVIDIDDVITSGPPIEGD